MKFDEIKNLIEEDKKTVNDLNSAVEAAVENLLDKYNNTINLPFFICKK